MTYNEFLKEEIKVALKEAEKYGFDEPLIQPEDDQLELYLTEILGVISFNKTVAKYFKKRD